MKKLGCKLKTQIILPLALLFCSLSSYAQYTPKVNLEVELKPYENETFAILPLTLNVTHFINEAQFDTITLEELKLSLMQLNKIEKESGRFQVGVGGELVSFRDRIVMMNDGKGKRFQNFDIVSLDVVGLVKINQEVFVQLKAHASGGPQLSGNASIYANTDEEEQQVLDTNCPTCEVTDDSWSESSLTGSAGAELSITVRKFQLSIFSESLVAKGSRSHSYDSSASRDDYFTHVRKFNQTSNGIRLTYQPNKHVALFVGYKLFTSSLDSSYKRVVNKNDHGSEYQMTYKGDLSTAGEFSKHQSHFFEVGLKVTPCSFFKIKKGN